MAFMTKKLHFKHLAQALYNLPHCRKVSLEDATRPWGAFRLGRRIGTLPSRFVTNALPNSVLHAMVCIRTLFVAVVKGRLPIEELHIDFGTSMAGCTAAFPRILSLPRELAQAACTQLCTVTTLHVAINPDPGDNKFNPMHYDGLPVTDPLQNKTADWTEDFLGFIGLFPALSTLSLYFFRRDKGYQFPRLSQEFFVPHLQSISLELVDCTRSDLMALIERHKETLQTIRLKSVSLPGGSADRWSSVVQSFRDDFSIQKLILGSCFVDRPWPTTDLPEEMYAGTPQELDMLVAELLELEKGDGSTKQSSQGGDSTETSPAGESV
ncbi:F-box domain-containing protein [Colletotrichum tofieldiae]|nr:F-box domain-containing protein [Colletotrichum tofieldiae]GKT81407.1 F-box domain-containing protein [Colletotrichum tofieldiae]